MRVYEPEYVHAFLVVSQMSVLENRHGSTRFSVSVAAHATRSASVHIPQFSLLRDSLLNVFGRTGASTQNFLIAFINQSEMRACHQPHQHPRASKARARHNPRHTAERTCAYYADTWHCVLCFVSHTRVSRRACLKRAHGNEFRAFVRVRQKLYFIHTTDVASLYNISEPQLAAVSWMAGWASCK